MAPQPDNILPHAALPTRRQTLRTVARHCRTPLLILAILFIAYYALIHGASSGQVRLDSGDIRYCWLGIPLYYSPMPEPYRSKILSLTSAAVSPKWVAFDKYPMDNWHDHTHRFEYGKVAAWADADPNIARWVLADLADDLEHSPWCLTKSYRILNPVMIDALPSNWRDNDDVNTYCAAHGYTPPPATAPAPKP